MRLNNEKVLMTLETKISKGWGIEIIHYNENICFKTMHIKKGHKCSMHYHAKKQEIFYVIDGILKMTIINTKNAEKIICMLNPGDSFLILPNVPHQFEAKDDVKMLEFSTHHDDSDSYRVEPGDSQLEKE